MGDLKKVGRIGVKSLLYFEIVSTIALAIGIIVGYIAQPGKIDKTGLEIQDASKYTQTSSEGFSWLSFFMNNATLQVVVIYVWTAILLLVVLDTILIGILLSKFLRNEFPEKAQRKGAVSYGVLRALQLRRFRIPPPRIKPGGKPVTPKVKK